MSVFVAVLTTIAVQPKDGLAVDIRLPLLHGNLSQIGPCARQPDGRRKAVHEHIVPLVKDGYSPITIGNTREAEAPISGALGERKVFAVRVSEAHEALGESEAAVIAAAVESFIRRPAHALGRDGARPGTVAVGAGD